MEQQQDRVRAVELLLRDLLAYLPRARQPSDVLSGSAGLAPGRSLPCSACGARGRVLEPGKVCISCPPRLGDAPPPAYFADPDKGVRISQLHGCKPCLNCSGTGWKRVHVPKGQMGTEYDEYSGTRHGESLPARDTKVWEREQDTARQLRRAETLLALWENDESVEVSWEERRQRQWKSGSYPQLMHALGYIEQQWPRRFSLVWRVYALEQQIELSETLQEKLAETLGWIAKLMPKEILVPSHIARELNVAQTNADRKISVWRGQTPAHARQRAERDDEVVRLRHEEEWKISRLARYFALSERQIKNILSARGSTASVATVAA